MQVTWSASGRGNRRYAYFRHSYREDGQVKTVNIFLGKTLAEAERRLEEEMLNGLRMGFALTSDEKARLMRQLREGAPPEALEPPVDWPKQNAVRAVRRLIERYRNRPDIVRPLQEALKVMEGSEAGSKDGRSGN